MLDKILKALAVFMLLFVITMIVIFVVTGSTPDTLITCVFAACTGELSVMGWIKNTKERIRKELNDEEPDE